jgi:hypothetical protein
VDTGGASLITLNALDLAIVSAKRLLEHGSATSSTDAPLVSSSIFELQFPSELQVRDLPELVRQAEKSLSLEREVCAMVEAMTTASVENGNTCIVCLAAPKDSLLLPRKPLGHVCGVHKGCFYIEQSATVPRV